MRFFNTMMLLAALLISSSAFSQKIEETVVKYDYTRLPLHSLGDDLKHYSFTVKTPYPENNDEVIAYAQRKHEEAVADYPRLEEETRMQYEEAMASYPMEVEMARENYRIEVEAFQQKSKLAQLADENPPALKLPRKPYYHKPREPVYQDPDLSQSIVFIPEVLANTHLNLDGKEKGMENALIGHVEVYDFEASEPETKTTTNRVYNSQTKQYTNQTVYTYEYSSKRPTHLKLEYNGVVLFDDIFGNTGDYVVHTSSQRPNMFEIEKLGVGTILDEINEFINDNYGYTQMHSSMTVRSVKNKDGSYDDLEEADKLAERGIKPMGSSNSEEDINGCIALWEKALAESDVDNKKARINEKVTQALLLNLVEMYTYTNAFVKAEDKLLALKELDVKGADAVASAHVKKIEERRARFEAQN